MYKLCKLRVKIILVLPSVVFFLVFTLYPTYSSLIVSLTDKTTSFEGKFIGLANYIYLFKDGDFLKSLMNTAVVLVAQVALILPLGFLLGIFLDKKFKGSAFVKLLAFTPVVLSGIMTGLIWLFILDPGIGLINQVLNNVGLQTLTQKWIGGTVLTPYSIAVVDTWKSVGFYAVLFMAGIKMIPKEILEAAVIDGASNFKKIVYITIPMLKEITRIIFVLIVVGSIKAFEVVFTLTNGSPNNQSHLISTYLYKNLFDNGSYGYGSAITMIMVIIIVLITIPFLKFTNKKIEE